MLKIFTFTVCTAILVTPLFAETINVVPGPLGGPADFDTGPVTLDVGADGSAEIWVEFDPFGIAAPPEFSYTADFSWTTPSSSASLVFEGVGDASDTTINFSDAGIDTTGGATMTSISRGLAFPGFPFDVYSYHARVEGLTPGDVVTFQKIGMGGTVVPEPAVPNLCLLIGLTFLLRKKFSRWED